MSEREKFEKWWGDNMPAHYIKGITEAWWGWEARAKLAEEEKGKVKVRVRHPKP